MMIMVQGNDEYYEEVIDNIDDLDEDADVNDEMNKDVNDEMNKDVNDEMNKDVNDEMISNHSLLC